MVDENIILDFEAGIKRRGILPALVPGKAWAGGYCIEQSARELAEFCAWLRGRGVRTYVELGVSSGGLFRFMQETWGFEWALGVDLHAPSALHLPDTAKVVIGDLRKPETIEALKGLTADLVFVDADHTYESIVQDTRTALSLNPSIVAFHDVAGLRECEGARKHWEEVKDGKHIPLATHESTLEFVNADDPVGIGVVTLRTSP